MIGNDGQHNTRINGSLMQSFLQKPVTLMGIITKAENDGKRATLQTTDGQYVQLLFVQPLMTPLIPNCLMEAIGVVLSRNQLQCHDFCQFPQEMTDKFDRETYNEFVAEYVKQCDQHINNMVEEEHEGSVIVPTDNFSMPVNTSSNDTFSADISFNNF